MSTDKTRRHVRSQSTPNQITLDCLVFFRERGIEGAMPEQGWIADNAHDAEIYAKGARDATTLSRDVDVFVGGELLCREGEVTIH